MIVTMEAIREKIDEKVGEWTKALKGEKNYAQIRELQGKIEAFEDVLPGIIEEIENE